MSSQPKPSWLEGVIPTWTLLFVILAAVLILFGFRLYVTVHRTLSPFEGTVSDALFLFLSLAFTWGVAKRDEERKIMARQKALAKSALRRVTGIAESAARLLASLSEARKELRSDSLWKELDEPRRRVLLEILNSLTQQLLEMRGTIVASTEDWGEILPDELDKIKTAQQRILQQEEQALDAIAAEMERLEKLVQEGRLKEDELKRLIEEKTANIENKMRLEIERIRSENRPFGSYGLGSARLAALAASGSFLVDPSLPTVTLSSLIPEVHKGVESTDPKKKEPK